MKSPALEASLEASLSQHRPGRLCGIGVGPGDPELITVKALRRLQAAPIVAFPAGLRGEPGVAQSAISTWLQPHQQQLPLTFPYVQDEAILKAAWKTAADQVWQAMQNGDVVFASEGDISFYSTFTYLAQSLLQQHPEAQVEAVPGICSPLAAAAALGIPLTVRSQRLAVLPALYQMATLEAALAWAEAVVLLKVSSVYAQVWSMLQQQQLLEHSYVVKHATRPDQMIYAGLKDWPDLKLPYFSLLIIRVPHRRP
ncbi:precorrin-2 C(20)-methyltransferase [Romeria aff. gracilis LEGE 07310]|uniref:Precorrin-2 C(20)-methyltransferase n=1 Tax=Vasconcelosia minhoensis LEGE 07310 TaxID=915328 RepID=A0A8J7ALD2_9CYAN|nr:precorrin-2 C(20)-methyltransferase [Romeria gracilis]MBE9076719.1 precorrin-2 C(20)-methyltransferase [Romeria aff. gracilis LEGE 07310]